MHSAPTARAAPKHTGMRVCVYCASSPHADPAYRKAATDLGGLLAGAGCTIVYGGGGTGSMAALADGALAADGQVIGVIPRFMIEVEWQHPGVANMEIVEDMRERKHRLLSGSDAVVALPGGSGTLEELFEALTLKRLALYAGPIILLNTLGFYTPLQRFMEQVIEARFMTADHGKLWTLVDQPDEVLPAIRAIPPWTDRSRAPGIVRAP